MSIIQELQHDASGSVILTSELLRKALIVATKLRLEEFKTWVEYELRGYPVGVEIPDYRSVRGQLVAINPINRVIPIYIASPDQADLMEKFPFHESVAKIADLSASGANDANARISRELPSGAQNIVHGLVPETRGCLIYFTTSSIQLNEVIEIVRNTILYWSLKLEEDGIIGENLSFSQQEKEIAHSHNYNIGTFIGEMNNSQIQQDTVNSNQTQNNTGTSIEEVGQLMRELSDWLPSSSLDEETREEIQADLESVQAQTESPKPKAKIISFALTSIHSALEKAAATAIAGQLPDIVHIQHWADQLAIAVQHFPIHP